MKRRDFIAGLGSAAAWPLVASAQPLSDTRDVARGSFVQLKVLGDRRGPQFEIGPCTVD